MSEHEEDDESGTGLPLIRGAFVSADEIQATIDLFRGSDAVVMADLTTKGIPVSELQHARVSSTFPSIDLELLGGGGSEEYERMNGALLHWHGVIVSRIALAKNRLLGAENGLTSAKALVKKNGYKQYRAKGVRSIDELDTLVNSHPSVIDALHATQVARQELNLLEAFRSKIEAGLRAVSRHVTVRGQDILLNTQGERTLQNGEERSGSRSPHQLPWLHETHAPLPAQRQPRLVHQPAGQTLPEQGRGRLQAASEGSCTAGSPHRAPGQGAVATTHHRAVRPLLSLLLHNLARRSTTPA